MTLIEKEQMEKSELNTQKGLQKIFRHSYKIYKWALRIKKWNWTLYISLSKVQTLEGVTTLLPNGKHVIFLDFDNCTENECVNELKRLMHKYHLSDFFVVYDKVGSYRPICFTQVTLRRLVEIQLNSKLVSEKYAFWTQNYGYATTRMGRKYDREKANFFVVPSRYKCDPPPKEWFRFLVYDTPLTREKVFIKIGDKKGWGIE